LLEKKNDGVRSASRRMIVCILSGAVLLLGILHGPNPARADDPTCDSLGSVTPGEGTVWSWFEHPCPPAPEETESGSILPGVGVTLQGFWIPLTGANPTGTPVSQSLPLIGQSVSTGYGGGLEFTGWLAQNLAMRFQADLWNFPSRPGLNQAFSMLPILLGLEVRLLGGDRVYLYVAADGGIAANGMNVSNAYSGTGWGTYAQGVVGLNFYALQFEASYGVLMNPLQLGTTGLVGTGGKTNPFFIVPLSVGFHL